MAIETLIEGGPAHTDESRPVNLRIQEWRVYFFLALTAAQRFRIASAIRLRASADILRLFFGATPAGLFVLPGGLPRRFAGADVPPLTPSRA